MPTSSYLDTPRVAYVMSRFPKLTETFIVSEIRAVERLGVDVEIYPLLRHRDPFVQPDAIRLVDRAHYEPFVSWRILGSQVVFLISAPRRYLSTLALVMRVTWGSFNFLVGGLATFAKVAHIARVLRSHGVRHVHCHFANHPALAGLVIHRLADIPYSFTAHGSDLHRDRHGLRAKVSAATFVVAISAYNRKVILDACGQEFAWKVAVIHCGVDTGSIGVRVKQGRRSDMLRILCVGTLHEVKGQTVLIDALASLADRGVRFSCRLIGEGPDRHMLAERIAHHKLEDSVSLDGARTNPEVMAALAEADILVAPSVPSRDGRREGIPVVIMEAMAAGLPVIASDLSGIPEIVEDGRTGRLTPPRNPEAIARALFELASNVALRERMGHLGRLRVEREFNADVSALQLVRRFLA